MHPSWRFLIDFPINLEQHAEGVWAAFNVSIDTIQETLGAPTFVNWRRFPSGCVMQNATRAKVTNSTVHYLSLAWALVPDVGLSPSNANVKALLSSCPPLLPLEITLPWLQVVDEAAQRMTEGKRTKLSFEVSTETLENDKLRWRTKDYQYPMFSMFMLHESK